MRLYLFLSLLSLSACQSAEPSLVTVPEQTGVQVENWQGAATTVTAKIYGDDSATVIATGTVSAAGELRFKLEPVSTAQLSRFTACPGVTVSDEALKLGSFSALEVVRGGVPTGQIAQTSSLEVVTNGLRQTSDYYVQYTYADRDANVSGRCQGGAPATFSYTLELQEGWNPVVFKLLEDGVLELSTEPVPQDAAWFFNKGKP